jgi:hypothetical protein
MRRYLSVSPTANGRNVNYLGIEAAKRYLHPLAIIDLPAILPVSHQTNLEVLNPEESTAKLVSTALQGQATRGDEALKDVCELRLHKIVVQAVEVWRALSRGPLTKASRSLVTVERGGRARARASAE